MAKIYRQNDGVFIKNETGAFFSDQLKAIAEADGTVTVLDEVRDIEIMSHIAFNEFFKEDDSAHGTDQLTTVDSLNATFTGTGTVDPRAPEITSSDTININEGDSINYTLEADRGLLFEFVGLPDGVVMMQGKPRQIIGGTGLTDGTYTATMRAVNFYGEDTKTLSIVVGDVAFASTFATKFHINDRAQTDGLDVEGVLGRSGEGSGADDAWTMNGWVKPTVASDQQLFSFGSDEGQHQLIYNADESVSVRYGDDDNYVEVKTGANTAPTGGYKNLTVTYDGGTTGFSGEKFENVVVGGETLENHSFDESTGWNLVNASYGSGEALLQDGDASVSQKVRVGEGLVYDVSVEHSIAGDGTTSTQSTYATSWPFPGYTTLADIRNRVNNTPFSGKWHVNKVQLELNTSADVPTRSEWFSPIALNEQIVTPGFGTSLITNTIVRFEVFLDLPAGSTTFYIKADDGYEVFFGGSSVTARGGNNSYDSLIRQFSVSVASAGVYQMSINYYNSGVVGGFILATDSAATIPVSTDNYMVNTLSPRDLILRASDESGALIKEQAFTVNSATASVQSMQFTAASSSDVYLSVSDSAYTSPESEVSIHNFSAVASHANNPGYLTDAADFFTRFKVYIDGSEVSTTGSIKGNGWSKSLTPDRMYFGKTANQTTLDEWSLYDGVQVGVASAAYNGGSPVDLATITPTPDHWWRMGDGDTFPQLNDSVGSANLTMINMIVSDIVNDTP